MNLHEAIREKNTEEAINLIKSGADIESYDKVGLSPLFLAAYFGQTDVAGILLEKGANIDVILRQNPAPKTIPASSGSGPTCIIADIPDLDAYGKYVTTITKINKLIDPYNAGIGPLETANKDK